MCAPGVSQKWIPIWTPSERHFWEVDTNSWQTALEYDLPDVQYLRRRRHHHDALEAIVADTPRQNHRTQKICKRDVTQKLITKMWLHTVEKIMQGEHE